MAALRLFPARVRPGAVPTPRHVPSAHFKYTVPGGAGSKLSDHSLTATRCLLADKANLPMPKSLSLYSNHTHAVTEVCGKAGDAVIFTETCSHGTLPWRGKHQRRALLYKFINGYQSFSPGQAIVEYPEWMQNMPPEQAAVLLAAFGSGKRDGLPSRL